MNYNFLITGGCGFIGTNFIRMLMNRYPFSKIVNIDALTYAGNRDNLIAFEEGNRDDVGRYKFFHGDITVSQDIENAAKMLDHIDVIVNFAAESHVDNSIKNPGIFVKTNVEGTLNLLKFAQEKGIKRFVQISTDEVYGSLGEEGYFTENSHLKPNSPYSASKAAADLLVGSFHKTYGLDTRITRCSNNYGPYQYPEKLIPLAITNLIENKKIPVYGRGQNVRDWIHVDDHCSGIIEALKFGNPGEVYNIGCCNEQKNIDIVKKICRMMELNEQDHIEFVEDRKGHDFRYAIEFSKIRDLKYPCWEPRYHGGNWEHALYNTVQWYTSNQLWWKPLKEKLQSYHND